MMGIIDQLLNESVGVTLLCIICKQAPKFNANVSAGLLLSKNKQSVKATKRAMSVEEQIESVICSLGFKRKHYWRCCVVATRALFSA